MLQEEAKPADLESGGGEDEISLHDPNNKNCYQPVLEKVQPVVDKARPVVEKTAKNISEFFEDDENEEMTEETVDGETREKTLVRFTPTTFGAAVVGMVVGSVIAGPIIGLAVAGGAGYASTRSDKIGEVSKTVGKKTYNGLRRGYLGTKEFIESKIPDNMRRAPAEEGAEVAVAVPVPAPGSETA